MRYIVPNAQGILDFDPYFAYLATLRGTLSEALYQFAANPAHYDLNSPESLHDAWLQSLHTEVTYNPEGLAPESRTVLTLLGPQHDRLHILSYRALLGGRMHYEVSPDGRKRDLLVHELRYDKPVIEHELQFDGGMSLEFRCLEMEYRAVMLRGQAG